MVGLGIPAEPRHLGFDEIADVRTVAEFGARTQPRIRTNHAAIADLRAVDVAMRTHLATVADGNILEPAERADAHIVAKHHIAFEDHIDIDGDIAPGEHRAAQVESRRIGQPHAGQRERLRCAQLVCAFKPRELPWIVRALDLDRVGARRDGRRLRCSGGLRKHIGQVKLALRVVVAQCIQPAPQRHSIGDDDAGVDRAHGALRWVSVLVFDDRGDAVVGVAQHATIAGRIVEFGDQHGERAIGREQRAQGVGSDQRHIGVQHQHARVVGHVRHRLLHRMPSAELLRLFGPDKIRLVGERRAHLRAAMPVHNMDACGTERARDIDHMREHRATCDRLQHLRQRGFHALAFAGGENDDVQRMAHAQDSNEAHQNRRASWGNLIKSRDGPN